MKSVLIASVIFAVLVLTAPMAVFAKSTTTVVEYALPYPGMLPDHPLYSIKALRDRIMDFLIVDPARKAEFSLLQADKRLGMGMALVEKGNVTLAESVVSKGEKYMHRALYSLMTLKYEGKAVPGYVVDRLKNSLAKHTEVLGTLVTRASGPEKSGLDGSLDLVGKLTDELPKLK